MRFWRFRTKHSNNSTGCVEIYFSEGGDYAGLPD